MNIYLEKVKEFMLTFGQPVLDKPTELPEDRQKLRIALIFEELKEYAEASGQLDYFIHLCQRAEVHFTNDPKNDISYIPTINQVEQFDALLDLQYVLSGAVHEHGFGEVFDEGFDEVHRSNMSKVDNNPTDANITKEKYEKEGIETWNFHIDGLHFTYRKSDNKVLKSHKYSPANLKPILDKNNKEILIYLSFRGIDDWHRAIFKDKNSTSYYGDCNCNKTGKPEDVIEYYKNNIDKLEYFGESFNCEPHGGINSNIKLIIE